MAVGESSVNVAGFSAMETKRASVGRSPHVGFFSTVFALGGRTGLVLLGDLGIAALDCPAEMAPGIDGQQAAVVEPWGCSSASAPLAPPW